MTHRSTRRLRRSVAPIEWAAWLTGAGLVGLWTGGRMVEFGGGGGGAVAQNADPILLMTAAAGVFVPLRLLLLVTTPGHYAVRRGLGESPASILTALQRESWVLAVFTVIAAAAVASLVAVLAASGGGVLKPVVIDALALHLTGLLTVHLLAVAATNRALVRVFDGGGAWRAISGGGAFGPAQTAPLLYAPAVGYAVGLVPTALAVAWLNGTGGIDPATATSSVPIWPIYGLVWVVLADGLGRLDRAAAKGRAAAGLVLVAELLKRGFVRSEAVAEPGRWLLIAAPDARRAAAVRFVARSWVRRYPASPAASLVLVAWAAWLLQPGASMVAVALVALGIGLYSVFRAYDLVASMPRVGAAVDAMTAPIRSHERAVGDLAIGLGIPGLAALALGWTENQWLGAVIGVVVAAIVGFVGTRGAPRPGLAWVGRFGMLLVLAGIGIARWEFAP